MWAQDMFEADSISVDEVATSLQQNLLSQELCHACEPEFEGLL